MGEAQELWDRVQKGSDTQRLSDEDLALLDILCHLPQYRPTPQEAARAIPVGEKQNTFWNTTSGSEAANRHSPRRPINRRRLAQQQ